MVLKKFLKKLKLISQKKTTIIILGRGTSVKYFLKNYKVFRKKNSIVLGYNTNEIIDKLDFLITNKNMGISNKTIFLKNLISILPKQLYHLKVGNVQFGLYLLLSLIEHYTKKKQDIYLWGFDFRSSNINNDYLKKKISGNFLQKEIIIRSQSILFNRLKDYFKKLNIITFGYNFFSDCDPRLTKINQSKKKKSNKVLITAEITTNHFGKDSLIKTLIKNASEAGADYVKFQMRDVENFYTKNELNKNFKSPFGKTFRDYRNGLELSDSQIILIKKLCKKYNIKPFFSVLDIASFEKLKKYKFSIIKIPSTVSEDKELINYVSKNYKGEIVISIGMTDVEYIHEIIKKFLNCKKVYVLHCVSSYPAFASDLNIGVITYLKKLSEKYKFIIPGYSSHDLTIEAGIMAVAAGAKMIEKHVRFGENEEFHFNDTALDVKTEFKEYIKNLRYAERIYGSEKKRILKSEFHKYRLKKTK